MIKAYMHLLFLSTPRTWLGWIPIRSKFFLRILTSPSTDNMLKTGIRMLDEKIGAIPDKSSIVIMSSLGIDPSPFGITILLNAMERDVNGLYIVNNKPSVSIRKEAKIMGFDLTIYERIGIFNIVDAFSGYMGMASNEKYVVADPFNPANFIEKVSEAQTENSLVILDSMSSYMDMVGNGIDDILHVVKEITKKSSVIALFSAWAYEAEAIKKIKDAFDAVLILQPLEEVTIVRTFLTAEKIAWKDIEGFTMPIKLLKPGGVRAYFPKILIIGSHRAGKTQIIKTISTSEPSIDLIGTTSLEQGYIEYKDKGFSADIYGMVGREPLDPILEYLGDEIIAAIIVIDSTDIMSIIHAKNIISQTIAYNIPYVVAANQQDRDDAMSVEEIKKRLTLPEHITIIPTVALTGKGIKNLLDAIVEKAMGGDE
ncbi:MAG: ATPase domain-containing protein [Methanosarcinales archaeon]